MSSGKSEVLDVEFEEVGEGATARSLYKAGEFSLSVWEDFGDGEPRMRDLDVAERLGFKTPRMIRKLVKRTWSNGHLPKCRSTVERQSVGRNGGGEREYEVDEYWLTEPEILKLCARSRTPIAEAILDTMIQVFIAVRRRQAVPHAPPTTTAPELPAEVLGASLATGGTVGDLVQARTVLVPYLGRLGPDAPRVLARAAVANAQLRAQGGAASATDLLVELLRGLEPPPVAGSRSLSDGMPEKVPTKEEPVTVTVVAEKTTTRVERRVQATEFAPTPAERAAIVARWTPILRAHIENLKNPERFALDEEVRYGVVVRDLFRVLGETGESTFAYYLLESCMSSLGWNFSKKRVLSDAYERVPHLATVFVAPLGWSPTLRA